MPAIVADHPCVGVPYHGPKLSTFRAVWASRARIRVDARATPAFVRVLCHVRYFFWQLRFTLLDCQALPAVLIQCPTQFLGMGKDFLCIRGLQAAMACQSGAAWAYPRGTELSCEGVFYL